MNRLRKRTKFLGIVALAFALLLAAPMAGGDEVLADATVDCTDFSTEYTANVVVFDTPMVFNRLGAQNPNWMMYALARDVVAIDQYGVIVDGFIPSSNLDALNEGEVALRPDKRPRPLVLRVPACSTLVINFKNLLDTPASPFEFTGPDDLPVDIPDISDLEALGNDNQVAGRYAGIHVQGMQLVNSTADDGTNVGAQGVTGSVPIKNGLVEPGEQITYRLIAERDGAFLLTNQGATFGGEASGGNVGVGMFGMVVVEPPGARIYRSQVTEEELRLATTGVAGNDENGINLPLIDYEKRYPRFQPVPGSIPPAVEPTVWQKEGKGGMPVLNMINTNTNEIVHSEINAIVAGPNPDGTFNSSSYPNVKNPVLPNRLEAYREFASVWHDENAAAQAFPAFWEKTVNGLPNPLSHTIHGVRDSFMINYGSGGIGSEIIANRLGVGPMYDCLGCAYEEFFLTSFTVGDPAMRVDIPANVGLEECHTSLNLGECGAVGPKANFALYPDDPANVHHSYVGDFAKFRNVHAGPKEQHVFHLHNHQWLFNASDDNANYLDAQGIGPGSSYTYEINFGGSGNRNKTAGDAIFHCHFYPHFAQGMWYMWRIHDVLETGTLLQVSGGSSSYHTEPFALQSGLPAAGARALPDGEILAGTPIPAVVPMPGKPMPPIPGEVTIVQKDADGDTVMDSSQANVIDRDINPGYPFWIAGVDCGGGAKVDPVTGLCADGIVGQRPPTPQLDMLPVAKAEELLHPTTGDPFFKNFCGNSATCLDENKKGILKDKFAQAFVNGAGGFDGGLPRHSLDGCKAAAFDLHGTDPDFARVPGCTQPLALDFFGNPFNIGVYSSSETRFDFHKEIEHALAILFPEEGTHLEKVAMAFHAQRTHAGYALQLDGYDPVAGDFVVNGAPPVPGAPYNEPCVDDQGDPLYAGVAGDFFNADGIPLWAGSSSDRNASTPFTYKGANIQIDAVFNKVGYHYPQQRIIALWDDVEDTINKLKAPEPFVMRLNSYDCAKYLHTNLVPKELEVDDYQVRTPTDIIGQHIHLPKWDLTTADGAANGWNYEDGTLSPGMVVERIHAIANHHFEAANTPAVVPGFPAGLGDEYKGARVTTQRWFADPVQNRHGEDRGLGIIFTHDHYGPSTHQQIGLYATLLIQPAGSKWYHNETGTELGTRKDGGPTSWQAAIVPPKSSIVEPFREFFFEFSDFQHAYEAGVYVGAGPDGRPGPAHCGGVLEIACAPGIPDGANAAYPVTEDSFRHAINPSYREQAVGGPIVPKIFPDISRHPGICPDGSPRPCPEAISADDPGMLVVNYRNEPVGLRVFDPNRLDCPDDVTDDLNADNGGCQAAGQAGDLAFALHSGTTRTIPQLNVQPLYGDLAQPAVPLVADGTTRRDTRFPPPINNDGSGNPTVQDGDPFTPMMRVRTGDLLRVKIQAGGHEHEHGATVHGVKWLQGGSGFGASGSAGWRNAQNDGISEQFTFNSPIIIDSGQAGNRADYAYSIDPSQDGWWSGVWGILRNHNTPQNDLFELDNGISGLVQVANDDQLVGVCPRAPGGGQPTAENLREYSVTAVLANDVLSGVAAPLGVAITPPDSSATMHMGGPLDENGSLIYNPRGGTDASALANFKGPLHDPTTIMYVYTDDMVDPDDPKAGLLAGTPLEPIVLRANAGDCIEVTLRNRLLDQALAGAEPVIDADGNPVYLDQSQDLFVDDNENGLGDVAYCLPEETYDAINDVCCPEGLTFDGTSCTDATATADAKGPLSELVAVEDVAFDSMPDLAGVNTLLQMVTRDRLAAFQAPELSESVTSFNNNLIAPSPYVGLHAQLVEYDVTRHDGAAVGLNAPGQTLVEPGSQKLYRWYAGDVSIGTKTVTGRRRNVRTEVELVHNPIELGGSNLSSADKIKHGQKGLVGALVIEPQGSSWPYALGDLPETERDRQQASSGVTRKTRADVPVTLPFEVIPPIVAKDHVIMVQKGLNLRYKDGTAVENIAGEGGAIPEDSHDAGQKGINYGTEPAWFRFGLRASTPFGTLGTVTNPEDLYANALAGEPPATPVFRAPKGSQVWMRLLEPTGVGRGTTFSLHGHHWQRDPYLAGIVPAQTIGINPLAFYLGGQESVTPYQHFTIFLDKAGGEIGVTGDYLFRDQASFGNTDGIWGIFQVH